MKPNLLFSSFILMASLLLTACQPEAISSEINTIETAIAELKADYAPDKRVALWDLAVKEGNPVVLKGRTNLPEAKKDLDTKLSRLDIAWTDSIRVLPEDSDLGDQVYGIVNLSACNIRSKSGHSQELATQSTMGTPLLVYEKVDNWYLVQTPDGYLGWLDAGGFTLMDQAELNNWKDAAKVVYLPDMGFSYTEPNQESNRVSDLLAGNILRKNGTSGGFTQVVYPDGRTAYVPNNTLMDWEDWITTRSATPSNILATAQAMLGRPYLWGGTSGKAYDCSGFTKTVYYLNGLILARDASQQVHTGAPINTDEGLDNVQPGDLLFFGRAATKESKERITHVAIYMGNDKIIHAAGQVKIESLNPEDEDFAPDRLKTFIRAKRMLVDDPGAVGVVPISDAGVY
ncbi:MAG: C40 family peptidase [Bacteroidota bacterium]